MKAKIVKKEHYGNEGQKMLKRSAIKADTMEQISN